MCSLNPGCVALAALPCQKNKQTGAHYVIHSAEPFCRVNLQLVLIHLAPRGGSRAVLQLWSKVLSHNLVTSPAAGRPLSRYIVAFHLKKNKKKKHSSCIYYLQSIIAVSGATPACFAEGHRPGVTTVRRVKHYQPTFPPSYIRTWPLARHRLPECSLTSGECVWPDTRGCVLIAAAPHYIRAGKRPV